MNKFFYDKHFKWYEFSPAVNLKIRKKSPKPNQSKEEGNYQESIHWNTTPDPGISCKTWG